MVKRKSNDEFLCELHQKNPNIKPLEEYINSTEKILFKCLKCEHEWYAKPNNVLSGRGCPECGKLIAAKKRLKSADEVYEVIKAANSNIEIVGEYRGANYKIKVKCKICGYVWETYTGNLRKGHGCPKCAKNAVKTHEEFLAELKEKNPNIIPLDEYFASQKKIQFYCKVCGHIWERVPNAILNGRGCPNCAKMLQTSFPEQAIFYYVKKCFPNVINSYYSGEYEIDIYIPDKKVGIEYDGVRWHKDKRDKDKRKNELCSRDGIALIRVREEGLEDICGSINIIRQDKYGEKDLEKCIVKVLNCIDEGSAICSVDISRDRSEILSNFLRDRKESSLQARNPELALEWNKEKNGKLTPDMIVPGSAEVVWWKCSKCGHEWKARVNSRSGGAGCPSCIGKVLIKGINDFKTKNPEIAKEWHPTKNGELTPDMFMQGAGKRAWWKCSKCGHEWESPVFQRNQGHGCPKCSRKGDMKKHDAFISELEEVNPNIYIETEYRGAHEKIECRCKVCGTKWQTTPSILLRGSRCPECTKQEQRQKLAKTQEQFEIELAKVNSNIEVKGKYVNTNTRIEMKCSICETSWSARPKDLLRGNGCPNCAKAKKGKKRKTHEQFMEELIEVNEQIEVKGRYEKSDVKIQCICKICGFEWMAAPSKLLMGRGCPNCARTNARKK